MILAIDIGNTHTVVAIFRSQRLVESWRLSSTLTHTADEDWIAVKLLCQDAGLDTAGIEGVVIGSVVPDRTAGFCQMAERYLQCKPLVVSYDLDLGLRLLIDEPAQLGADRICNAVAGRALFSLPQVIVDLGTATTFDVLDANGDYIGGAIAPGMITGSQELTRRAAQLYKIPLRFPARLVGKNTVEHMQSGIFGGHIAMIEGLCDRMRRELNWDHMHVIATGGLSGEIARHSILISASNVNLTIEGLRLIYERNCRH